MLRFGQFTEDDVKALLIDLREVAKHMVKALAGESNEFTQLLRDFVEVCDFIAHASRDRGLVEEIVRTHVNTLHANLTLTPEEFAQVPIARVLNANHLVLALVGVSSFAVGKLDEARRDTDVGELQTRHSEIGLCILSLLQDSFVSLKEGEGFGVLQLMPYEGMYRLYCRVINSRIERETRARTGGNGKVVLGFPVMISAAKCVDPDVFALDHEAFPQPIFETYRDPSSSLRVRLVDADGDA